MQTLERIVRYGLMLNCWNNAETIKALLCRKSFYLWP
nr:MAG TPA: hypothetical protein [Caudoviricetes sp.]